jgi:hypothetical protein
MDVRMPDGTVIANVPEGTTKADLVKKLQANGMAVPADWLGTAPQPERSVSASVGDALRDIPRQVGLTARYGAEAVTGLADTLASPIRAGLNLIPGVNIQPASATVGRLADKAGISPRNADERVIGDMTRTGFGAVGLMGGANALTNATTGGARQVMTQLAANPLAQGAGAVAAGGAGGAVREAGGGPVEQFIASLVGGVGGGMAANKLSGAAQSSANAIRRTLTPQTTQVRAADQQIQLALERSGMDWSQVPERIRQGLREEVAQALNGGGELNAAALRRLLAFRATGTTPTVGMLTQNPGQITREMNLAKTGANSTDPSLQRLPSLQNQNTQILLNRLDEAGAARAPDAAATATRAMGGLQNRVTEARGNIDRLYGAARDTEGRSLDLDRAAFANRANQLLDEAMVGGALPADVANNLNWIAANARPQGMHGSIPMPFTVEIAEQLKTRIGNLQRATSDGGARTALGLVRQALDETPLMPAPQVNPGNLPAVPGTVPPSPQTVGQQSIDAFNAARSANRQYMQTLEANPAMAAVDDATAAVRGNPQLRSVEDVVGAAGFMQKYVIGRSATPGEVRALVQQVGPEGAQALRQNVVRYLRDAATNSTDDITKFSNDAYRRALRDIGDEKLLALFSPEEVLNLRNVGQAAKYMQAQPAGSAVNNSNSGAMVLGKGLDMLDRAAGYVPLGGRDILRGWIQGAQQTQVLQPRNALANAIAQPRPSNNMLATLLAAPLASPVQAGQDDRRR